MPDQLSALYSEFLEGGYDCVDRIVLNAYFSMGQSGGGFRVWWRELYGSDENLDDNHLMRMAGRFSRRLRAWAQANHIPVVYCSAGEQKHKIAEQSLHARSEVRIVSDSGVQSAGAGVGGAEDGHRKARPVSAQRSLALRESLFLSYPGPRLGACDDQNEWASPLRRADHSQRPRICGGASAEEGNRVYQTGELLYRRYRRRRADESRRYLVSERDCRARAPTLRALDLQDLPVFCAGPGRTEKEQVSVSVLGVSDGV